MEKEIFKKVSVFIILGVLAVLTTMVLWPIAMSVITGLLLAYIFYPVYKKTFSIIKKKSISALIVVFLIVVAIILPLWYIFPKVVKQAFDFYLFIQNFDMMEFFSAIFPTVSQTEFSIEIIRVLNNLVSKIADSFFTSASDLILNAPILVLKVSVALVVFFFAMRDGDKLVKYGESISPFSKSVGKKLTEQFKGVTHSVIYGFIVIGVIQGGVTGLGLLIAGVPQTALLTLIAIIAAIIPIIGSWLVWLPAAIYLIANGSYVGGIFLLIYGVTAVFWIDNVSRPYVVARKIKISSAIVLIGMIGGLMTFGILGLIIGPLVLTYLLLVLDTYRNSDSPSLFLEEENKKKNISFNFLHK